ncbi:MAG TPA: hypothetical protein VK982_02900, partial [Bacteroidales bacterium]|nr:hypothetical protein [Bacteroidales bacterium]
MSDIIEGKNGRVCTNCKKLKSFDKFYNHKTRKYGKSSRCKICIRKKQNKKTRTERNIPRFRDKLKQSKFCNKCDKYKPFNEFYSHKEGKYGLRPECINCFLKQGKKYREENKEEVLKRKREHYYNNHEKYLKLKAERRKTKKWKEYNKQYQKEYRKNPENVKRHNKKSLERYHNNSLHRIKVNYRNSLIRLLKNGSSKRASEYLGCNFKQFKKHLENQFEDGMSWDNQGRGGW